MSYNPKVHIPPPNLGNIELREHLGKPVLYIENCWITPDIRIICAVAYMGWMKIEQQAFLGADKNKQQRAIINSAAWMKLGEECSFANKGDSCGSKDCDV